MAFPDRIRWDLGEDIPYEELVELLGEDSEDDNGASVVPAEDVSMRQQINEVQDLLDFEQEAEIDKIIFGNDETGEEEESVVDENDEDIFEDTEFAVLASGKDTEDVETETLREPADNEHEEEDYDTKLGTIIKNTYENANVKYTSRDKDIPKWEIVNCTTHKDIDTSASYAFMLGDQTDSLEEAAEHLKQEKTIKDGRDTWIPFGDVYRHPTTHNIEIRAISEDNLGKLAKAMDMSTDEVVKKLAEQVGRYKR